MKRNVENISRMRYHNVIEGIWTADDGSSLTISVKQRTSKELWLSHSQNVFELFVFFDVLAITNCQLS